MLRTIIIAIIIQTFGPLQLQAMCDSFSSDDNIDFFPLAQMDSEINSSLKTTNESGERKAVLIFEGERLPAVADTVSEENVLQPFQRK